VLPIVIAGCGSSSTKTVVRTVTAGSSTSTAAPTTSTTTSTASSTDCDALGINRAKLGEGTCITNGVTYTIVNKNGTVRLETLTAKLDGISTARSVSSNVGTSLATGRYVIITLTVTNRMHSEQHFGPVLGERQVELLLGPNQYTEDFEAENGNHEPSCVSKEGGVGGSAIQAGLSVTCDVIFDVPANLVSGLNTNANVFLTNFGDDIQASSSGPYGVIRTYH
jgi:hypothetical protein